MRGRAEGLEVSLDPVPMSPEQMIVATLLRVGLCWLTPGGLFWLDEYRARSAGRWPVLPQHHCGRIWRAVPLPAAPAPTISAHPPY